SFAGDYFFGDFTGSRVYRLHPNLARDGVTGSLATIVTGAGGPVDFVTGPGGAVYYVQINTGQVHQLTATAGPPPPTPLSGKKLTLKDNTDPTKKGLSLLSKDPIAFPDADPTIEGATIRVKGATFDDTYSLPASGWAPIGHAVDQKGFKYKDATLAFGPFKTAQIKTNKLVKASAKGAALGHELGSDPSPVDVVVTIGTTNPTVYCLEFGGRKKFKMGKQFSAKDAPVSPGCP